MEQELILKMIFNIIGGLGIFLLGMKYMSDGLQTVSGPSLRKMIDAVTNNKFLAVGVGVVVTSIVQSSSVTTVIGCWVCKQRHYGVGTSCWRYYWR